MLSNGRSPLSNSYVHPDGTLRFTYPANFLPQPVKHREWRAAAARHAHDSLLEAELPASGRAQIERGALEASETVAVIAVSPESDHIGQAAFTATSSADAMSPAEQLTQRLVWASALLTLASFAPDVLAGAGAAVADAAGSAAPPWLVRLCRHVAINSKAAAQRQQAPKVAARTPKALSYRQFRADPSSKHDHGHRMALLTLWQHAGAVARHIRLHDADCRLLGGLRDSSGGGPRCWRLLLPRTAVAGRVCSFGTCGR